MVPGHVPAKNIISHPHNADCWQCNIDVYFYTLLPRPRELWHRSIVCRNFNMSGGPYRCLTRSTTGFPRFNSDSARVHRPITFAGDLLHLIFKARKSSMVLTSFQDFKPKSFQTESISNHSCGCWSWNAGETQRKRGVLARAHSKCSQGPWAPST